MDNATQTDNSTQTGTPVTETVSTPVTETVSSPVSTSTGWKSSVRTDLRDSPLLQKFEDTTDGLNKALESHANLEKLLGHEKVPIPKDVNDVEGWNRFSKAMGIPDKAEGYGLANAQIPESMKDLTIDKNKFAEVMHAHKVHPSAVKGIWDTYQKLAVESYKNALDKHQKTMTDTVNSLKSEWGDAYQTNVELGQMVINKFSNDKDTNDYITSVLSQDPRGIKFLAKIGDQFAENKVGEFSMKRFTLSPDQAQEEIDKTVKDLEGPYMNTRGKFTEQEHLRAMDRVNMLRESINRAKGGQA